MKSLFGRPAHPSLSLQYRNVLVPVLGDPADEMAVRVAALAVANTHGDVSLLHVIEVPFQRQLDFEDPKAVAHAQRILEGAEELLNELHCEVRSSTVQARSAGAAIVDDAVSIGADLIVMGLPYKRRFGGQWNAGRTVPYVMRNSMAPVWCLRAETTELADVP
ncbi:MAG: universal stress protein [Candidatus Limnocylindria bacterium]